MERDELAAAYDFGSKEEFARNYIEEYVANPDPLSNRKRYEWGGSCKQTAASTAGCPSKADNMQEIIDYMDNVMYYKNKMEREGKREKDERLVYINKIKVEEGQDEATIAERFARMRHTKFYQN